MEPGVIVIEPGIMVGKPRVMVGEPETTVGRPGVLVREPQGQVASTPHKDCWSSCKLGVVQFCFVDKGSLSLSVL